MAQGYGDIQRLVEWEANSTMNRNRDKNRPVIHRVHHQEGNGNFLFVYTCAWNHHFYSSSVSE